MPTAASTAGAGADVASESSQANLVVVDASAIVSLLIDPGSAGDAIAARLTHATLLAPALLPFEVANVLRRRRNGGQLSTADADSALADFAALPIDLWPWETVATRAWQLGNNLSSYDAAYVALAEHTGATLVTRDSRIAKAPGIRCPIDVF